MPTRCSFASRLQTVGLRAWQRIRQAVGLFGLAVALVLGVDIQLAADEARLTGLTAHYSLPPISGKEWQHVRVFYAVAHAPGPNLVVRQYDPRIPPLKIDQRVLDTLVGDQQIESVEIEGMRVDSTFVAWVVTHGPFRKITLRRCTIEGDSLKGLSGAKALEFVLITDCEAEDGFVEGCRGLSHVKEAFIFCKMLSDQDREKIRSSMPLVDLTL